MLLLSVRAQNALEAAVVRDLNSNLLVVAHRLIEEMLLLDLGDILLDEFHNELPIVLELLKVTVHTIVKLDLLKVSDVVNLIDRAIDLVVVEDDLQQLQASSSSLALTASI